MKNKDFATIHEKEQLQFKNNAELEKYYHDKWHSGGYTKGYTISDIDISAIYQSKRQELALKNLDPKKEEIILDAGCGNGDLSIMIAPQCKKIYAIDMAKTAFQKNNTNPPKNLTFKKMNVEELKFKKSFFDKIVCIETIEHVLNPDKVLSEFNRVLKPNGTIVISYPYINKTSMAKFEQKIGIRKYFSISEHLTEWDYNETIAHFNKNGFECVHKEGMAFDIGFLYGLRKISKYLALKITKATLQSKNHPKNSQFVIFTLKKK